MKPFEKLTVRGRIRRPRKQAQATLEVYGLSEADMRFLDYSGNAHYRVDTSRCAPREPDEGRYWANHYILRLHQPRARAQRRERAQLATQRSYSLACKEHRHLQAHGPWIVTGLDPDELHVTIRLNELVVGEYDVASAIFGVRHFISRMSRYVTLHPGDVVWMGTDGDTLNMKDGDVLEVEISGIGVLRNPVVRER